MVASRSPFAHMDIAGTSVQIRGNGPIVKPVELRKSVTIALGPFHEIGFGIHAVRFHHYCTNVRFHADSDYSALHGGRFLLIEGRPGRFGSIEFGNFSFQRLLMKSANHSPS